MSKKPSSQAAKVVKRSIHFDELANGLLDAFGTVRKLNNSELITSLLIAEYHRTQGTEREAVRSVLKHLAIDVPRRTTGSGSAGQGIGYDDSGDGLATRNERLGEIVEKSHAPIDTALNEIGDEIAAKPSSRMSRFT